MVVVASSLGKVRRNGDKLGMEKFDYFVIGGGSGGVRSARIAASHGAKVGLAEKSALGGTCVNVGCVPKKLFSYAADYSAALEDMTGFGWKDTHATFDWQTLIQHKNHEIERLNSIYKNLLSSSGVTLYTGTARFVDQHTLDIDGAVIQADKILIAVGGTPKKPDFPGAEHAIVSDQAFYLKELPKKIVIQGGGYIAVEFAHIFKGLGAEVTLLYRGDLWMRSFDKDIRTFLKEEYDKQGIDVQFNCDVESIEKVGETLNVHTTDKSNIECDMVFSAIGRTPNTENLDTTKADISLKPNGQINVDTSWQTSVEHIYAIGDVSNQWNLTPYAIAEGHILADRLFGKDGQVRNINLDLIPTAIFSGPPIGTVGLSEEDAEKNGHQIATYKTSFKPLRHTLSGRDERTFMKLVIDKETDRVIGCHMVGADTPEMLQGIAIAMNAGATKTDFNRTLGIHPTSAEELVTMS